ncbi:hypothetical protein Zmor_006147 [Zophobas morio]|uniref:Uncharacterized protein n=1 Tax=Zophobas morio TaxID=2755281 RepID=A0AA38MNA8_9CUCU|nr:hypothetical protein Zmor_006147 [Zophobas morio]
MKGLKNLEVIIRWKRKKNKDVPVTGRKLEQSERKERIKQDVEEFWNHVPEKVDTKVGSVIVIKEFNERVRNDTETSKKTVVKHREYTINNKCHKNDQ